MTKPLYVGLPLMLHSEPEVIAFRNAQKRIQALGDELGQPIQVGAFLFLLPRALTDENRTKQLENQRKYNIPIIHAQATFQLRHNLVYSREQDTSLVGGRDLLEIALDQVSQLRRGSAQDQLSLPFHLDYNIGAFVSPEVPAERKVQYVYTLQEFLAQREELYQRAKNRFSELQALAKDEGLEVAVENAINAVFAPHPALGGTPQMYYHPFNGLKPLVDVSNGNLVFDSAHWIASRSAVVSFERNGATREREILFQTEGVNSWEQYLENNPNFDRYLPFARVLHMSNATGLGVFLEKYPQDKARWGDGGEVEGLIPRKDLRTMASHAIEQGKPVIIEVDYDIKEIPKNEFSEADKFLRYVLQDD